MARIIIKIFKIVFHITLYVILSYFLSIEKTKSVITVHRYLSDIKHILLWSNIPVLEHEGQKSFIDKQCKDINCYVTTNRNLLGDERYFDAIIFNAKEVSMQDWDIPLYRGNYQKYVFAGFDSADKVPICSPVYRDFFNWTWTYKTDSTITYNMVTVKNLENVDVGRKSNWIYKNNMKAMSENFKKSLQSKSKLAAIDLNECTGKSERERFLKKMQKELLKYNQTVDVFGKCGKRIYSKRDLDYILTATYYFYLAFENSYAPDYVTSIVLNGYNNNAIPVMRGGAQYSRLFPAGSYIDASYMEAKELAETLIYLIENKEKYYDYFRWKNHYKIQKGPGIDICDVCAKLNDPVSLISGDVYVSIRSWWYPEYRIQCKRIYYD